MRTAKKNNTPIIQEIKGPQNQETQETSPKKRNEKWNTTENEKISAKNLSEKHQATSNATARPTKHRDTARQATRKHKNTQKRNKKMSHTSHRQHRQHRPHRHPHTSNTMTNHYTRTLVYLLDNTHYLSILFFFLSVIFFCFRAGSGTKSYFGVFTSG